MSSRKFRKLLLSRSGVSALCCACLLWALPVFSAPPAPQAEPAVNAPAAQAPLQFGLLPYMSTRKLFAYYLPIKHYLEKTLGRPVHMSTAPDFATFLERARRGEYDLYHTAPHFAAQAEYELGYQRVSRLLRELDGSIVVARDGPIQRPEDLRGRTLSAPDPLAIITFLGEQWLQDNGLHPGVDVEVKNFPSHNTAILSVLRGEAAAAVTSAAVFENMSKRVSDQLRILTHTKKVPHMMFMASPRVAGKELAALRKAMLGFTARADGRAFFATTGYGDMGVIDDAEMQQLKPFITELGLRMKAQ